MCKILNELKKVNVPLVTYLAIEISVFQQISQFKHPKELNLISVKINFFEKLICHSKVKKFEEITHF